MSRQHQIQTSAPIHSQKPKSQFSVPPVIQPKAQNARTAEQLENKPGGSRQMSPLARLQQAAAAQAKLTIGQPNDKYEQEADRVAENVVHQIHTPTEETAQREIATQDAEKVQLKPVLQRSSALTGGDASTELESAIDRAKTGGQSLDSGLQQSMGQAMGADFSSVKVHTDTQSDTLNRSLQAKAFTTGQDVFFKKGEYNPQSRSGQALIAHEPTHVVQQTPNTIQRDTTKLVEEANSQVEKKTKDKDIFWGQAHGDEGIILALNEYTQKGVQKAKVKFMNC
ncbi:MAG: DUF4157 domain-containing protein [Cyanobacteria bacterium P01_G01_bin.54]